MDKDLRPLAVVCLERQERIVAQSRRWLRRPFFFGLGILQGVLAVLSWINGGPGVAARNTFAAVVLIVVGIFLPRLNGFRDRRLGQSRKLLVPEEPSWWDQQWS